MKIEQVERKWERGDYFIKAQYVLPKTARPTFWVLLEQAERLVLRDLDDKDKEQ